MQAPCCSAGTPYSLPPAAPAPAACPDARRIFAAWTRRDAHLSRPCQENFAGVLAADWRYERALRAVRLLSAHSVPLVVQELSAWRQGVEEGIKEKYLLPSSAGAGVPISLTGTCKRAAMDILVLDAAQQLLDTGAAEALTQKNPTVSEFYSSLQSAAFRWLLHVDEYVPYTELGSLRATLTAASSRVLGTMSRLRLDPVLSLFLRGLEERLNAKDFNTARPQLLKLCAGESPMCFCTLVQAELVSLQSVRPSRLEMMMIMMMMSR